MLTVSAEQAQADRVYGILEEHGSVDLDEREASWRQEGWSGYTGGRTTAAESAGGLRHQRAWSLREESVHVDRWPVDRAPTAADERLFEDRTIETTERVEEAVVSKDARVVEEVGPRKEADQHTETVQDTVRRTEVEVEDERGNVIRTGTKDTQTR